ncbi:FecR domain-containing protein [Rhodoferax sp.]|uniref:FecR family protein n=1 Tax=Rhodoferax sp. TaxID=50421 RepID=UPI00284FAB3A|nr:FecR domain-containing protein [Rhodoferax sp.]MDR3369632.1 FecR domain-containing protein [Rhodoferax sp.]
MKLTPLIHVSALALVLASSICLADEPVVGYVKTVQGAAVVVTAGDTIKAEPGTPVRQSSTLKTGLQASMGITLQDNTRLSIGPDTVMAVDEFLYEPTQNAVKLLVNLTRGTLNYVSGLIAKIKPDAVSIKTPTGNIGVRGTHFVAKVVAD